MSTGGNRAARRERREARIFDFCQRKAHEIIGELESSGGDHREDVEVLEGLIETWEHLEGAAIYEAQQEEMRDHGHHERG